jgi:5-methylcytosine-specific restriction endonuclease McrA
MQRLGEYSTEFVLSRIGKEELSVDGYRVKMWSKRYKVFQKDLCCAYCGLKGDRFYLERNDNDPNAAPDRAHFNLYAVVDGEDILFTKDHVLPKSKGGSDKLSNLVTACQICNSEKADTLL